MKAILLLLPVIVVACLGCGSAGDNRAGATETTPRTGVPTPFVPTLPTPSIVSGGVLNDKALQLPQPDYPAAGRAVKASGEVEVDVVIDEKGNVISAFAAKGHPLLRRSAERAAKRAKFAPTVVDGGVKKVTGILKYTFEPK